MTNQRPVCDVAANYEALGEALAEADGLGEVVGVGLTPGRSSGMS